MRLIITYMIWRKNMQIYNLKDKLEYLDEVAKLEYDEWADNKEKIENVEQKENKKIKNILKFI